MAKERSLVRASDLALWTFCQRAWWLAHVQAVAHRQPTTLSWGRKVHADHGRQVQRAEQFQRWGLISLGLAVLVALILLLPWLGLGGGNGR